MNGLSDRAKTLIPKARIMSFAGWTDVDKKAIAILQTADDENRYLTDEELSEIKSLTNQSDLALTAVGLSATEAASALRSQAADIVDEARAVVLATFPDILEPGGGLFPPQRAEACWRDFWQFLRCITYGIAGQQHHYTSTTGLAAMEQLYEELQVPLPAMVAGLIGVKRASLRRFPIESYAALSPYFDHLIARLSTFVKVKTEA
ncbi:phycobilisome protein [cf. Phormidesmis sp. LEGE 11477]|uniref:phycobilisome protein n=1 Tax=cf. Phormidesmis sp. LEGE 11477 TaxID=1828680 RepID=UPI001880AEEC|nr:phycobilisome protein [cf. Phormidesmis sp. LEGE 11477]MBE9060214.1 phycobilisome protein [cf. Phormidesmis sp. LEGE 11477]